MEPATKPPQPSREKQARQLAQELGRAILQELVAAKALHEYSKVVPLSIPQDLFDRNLKIKRRRWHVLAAKRKAAHLALKKHIGLPE